MNHHLISPFLSTAGKTATTIILLSVLSLDLTGSEPNWNGVSGNLWSEPSNWSTGVVPGNGDNVIFDQTALNYTVELDGDRTIDDIQFASAVQYDLDLIADVGVNTLSLQSGDITVNSGSHTINSNVALLANGEWFLTGNLNVAGAISGVGDLIKNGIGTLILNGANTHSGLTQINTGKIALNNANALQDSNVLINIDNGMCQ